MKVYFRFYICWSVVFLYAGLIFWLSSMSSPERIAPKALRFVTTVPNADKIIHAIEFAILCFLLCRSLSLSKRNKQAVVLAILLTIAYGSLDEIHQLFVPRRFASLLDLLADSFGALCAGLLWLQLANRFSIGV